MDLTKSDIELLLESLRYTRQKFETYQEYPNEAFRAAQLAHVDAVIEKLVAAKKTAP
jgi:hypothetical protein